MSWLLLGLVLLSVTDILVVTALYMVGVRRPEPWILYLTFALLLLGLSRWMWVLRLTGNDLGLLGAAIAALFAHSAVVLIGSAADEIWTGQWRWRWTIAGAVGFVGVVVSTAIWGVGPLRALGVASLLMVAFWHLGSVLPARGDQWRLAALFVVARGAFAFCFSLVTWEEVVAAALAMIGVVLHFGLVVGIGTVWRYERALRPLPVAKTTTLSDLTLSDLTDPGPPEMVPPPPDPAAGSERSIAESVTDGLLWFSLEDQTLLRCNSALCAVLGDDDEAQTLARGTVSKLMGFEVRADGANVVGAICQVFRPDGSVAALRLADVRADAVGIRWVLQDVSEAVALRHRLVHAERMEAAGRLAGGVAHDFNNVLSVVLANTELMVQRVGSLGELEQIRTAVEQAGRLTRQLTTLGQRDELRLEVMSLSEVVTGLCSLVQVDMLGTSLVTEVTSDTVVVLDRSMVEQIVLNLVLNARDAGAGRIHVRVWTELDRAHLVIEDDGPGIPDDAVDHIFEPFFTTKSEGRGLGLSTVYGAVRRLSGDISVDTGADGTTFRVVLPLDATLEGPVAYVEALEQPRPVVRGESGGGRSALVIEDDDRLRDVVTQLLQLEGWSVQTIAASADIPDILAVDGIELVISDVRLANEDGRDVVAALCAGGVAPAVLYMSGNPGPDWPDELPLLPKPFDADALYDAIREVLLDG